MEFLVLAVVLGLIPALIAQPKGRSLGSGAALLFLLPLLLLLFTPAMLDFVPSRLLGKRQRL